MQVRPVRGPGSSPRDGLRRVEGRPRLGALFCGLGGLGPGDRWPVPCEGDTSGCDLPSLTLHRSQQHGIAHLKEPFPGMRAELGLKLIIEIYKLLIQWLPAKPHSLQCLIFTYDDRIHMFSRLLGSPRRAFPSLQPHPAPPSLLLFSMYDRGGSGCI